jgi:hypothetical protein
MPAIVPTTLLLIASNTAPFAAFYMGKPVKLDYLYAGLCMLGAVYFIFRSPSTT